MDGMVGGVILPIYPNLPIHLRLYHLLAAVSTWFRLRRIFSQALDQLFRALLLCSSSIYLLILIRGEKIREEEKMKGEQDILLECIQIEINAIEAPHSFSPMQIKVDQLPLVIRRWVS